jgi:hypothetical protein
VDTKPAADTKAATLLKYRFGLFEHMQNHLHVVDGRTLFFYRDQRSTVVGGDRVVVEFSFGTSEQVTALRGSVLGRVEGEGGQAGAWIEFPDAKLARKIGGGAEAISARRQRRLVCDMMVEIRLGRRPFMGRMVDVSLGGARIVGPIELHAGAEVDLRIMGAKPPIPDMLGRAQVVRTDRTGDVGVRFVRTNAVARVASSKLYAAVEQSWAKTPEVAHSPLCCVGGHVLEPPLPNMKNRI